MPAFAFASLLDAAPEGLRASRKSRVLERMRKGNKDVLMAVELFSAAGDILGHKAKTEWTSRYHECNELRQLVEDAADELDGKGVNEVSEKYVAAAGELYRYSQVAVTRAKAIRIAGPSDIAYEPRSAGAIPFPEALSFHPYSSNLSSPSSPYPYYLPNTPLQTSLESLGPYGLGSPQFDAFPLVRPAGFRTCSPRSQPEAPALVTDIPGRGVALAPSSPQTRTLRSFKRSNTRTRAHSTPTTTSTRSGPQVGPSRTTDDDTRSVRNGARAPHTLHDPERSPSNPHRRRPHAVKTGAPYPALDRDSQLPPTPTIRDQFRTDGLASRVRPTPGNALRDGHAFNQRLSPSGSSVDTLWI